MISICIPTFNGEQYLAEAVTSVLAQTLPDFECLIVDDGSTDRTLDIAREFGQRDARVRVVQNPRNVGLAANWNRCVELASGDWIKFVFQDDYLEPTCLESLIRLAERTGVRLAFCERDVRIETGSDPALAAWFEDGLTRFQHVFGNATVTAPAAFCDAAATRLGANFLGEPTSALIHRLCFARYGAFNEDLAQICDLDYWCRVGCNEPVALTGERLATFRVHGTSTSNANRLSTRKTLRLKFDSVIYLTALLTERVFEPLRRQAPAALDGVRYWLLRAIEDVRLLIRDAPDPPERAWRAQAWSQLLLKYPAVSLVEKTSENLWQRTLSRTRSRFNSYASSAFRVRN
jgi:glycosyltransferase involved in cell wall biosynthesis